MIRENGPVMDKAPDAYRTISEVAEDLDLPQHVLRFWETRFAQIKPLKRGGGRRYYRPDDVELLKGIRHLLYKEGYTIKGVQRILKEQGVKAVQAFVRETLMAPPVAVHVPPLPVAAPLPPLSVSPASATRAVAETPPAPVVESWEPSLMRAAVPPAIEEFEIEGFEIEGLEIEGLADDRNQSHEAGLHEASLPQPPMPEIHTAGEAAMGAAAARGQVSMFRGGLQRGEGTTGPMAEFASQIRERVEHPAFRGETGSLGPRDALLMALDELVACRAAIDQVLARRQS